MTWWNTWSLFSLQAVQKRIVLTLGYRPHQTPWELSLGLSVPPIVLSGLFWGPKGPILCLTELLLSFMEVSFSSPSALWKYRMLVLRTAIVLHHSWTSGWTYFCPRVCWSDYHTVTIYGYLVSSRSRWTRWGRPDPSESSRLQFWKALFKNNNRNHSNSQMRNT